MPRCVPLQVRALLSAGADANARCRRASTPLHKAAYGGHTDVVEMLVTSGRADVHARTAGGCESIPLVRTVCYALGVPS